MAETTAERDFGSILPVVEVVQRRLAAAAAAEVAVGLVLLLVGNRAVEGAALLAAPAPGVWPGEVRPTGSADESPSVFSCRSK